MLKNANIIYLGLLLSLLQGECQNKIIADHSGSYMMVNLLHDCMIIT